MLIVHHPDGEQRRVEPAGDPAQPLSAVLHDLGWPLNTRCDQRGLCKGCLIEVLSGQVASVADSGDGLIDGRGQVLRACQLRLVPGPSAEIRIPPRSLLAHRPQVVTSFSLEVPRAHDPLWQLLQLRPDELADPPSLTTTSLCNTVAARREHDLPVRSQADDSAWIPNANGRLAIELTCWQDSWQAAPRADSVEPRPDYGLAIDVGTTTVVALLVDLSDGRVLGTASALNAQTRLGDNVLTRINLCMTDPGKVRRLQEAVTRRTLRPLLQEVLTEAAVDPEQVRTLVVAGNTTMLHLLAGVDPTPMGFAPFTPEFLDHRVFTQNALGLGARRLERDEAGGEGLRTSKAVGDTGGGEPAAADGECQGDAEPSDPAVPVHLLPGAAAYIGADVMAGVLSSGMAYRRETCLLVDVGTNGEIVLKHGDRFLACATAAGPAFEGSGLSNGMRAGRGAVSHITFPDASCEPELQVIDDVPPIGICGTAYVDFLAQARRVGLVGPTGRLTPAGVQHRRAGAGDAVREFEIGRSPRDESIAISEADIASLLQAKAAIAAGILCLLAEAQLQPREIATLYLAGGFGFHMDVENVLRCGLFPGFCRDQIRLVGNTSLAGAYLALLDSNALGEIKRISQAVETIELNLDPMFESVYIEQLLLPDE